MMHFMYRANEDIMKLVHSTIPDYNVPYLYGILEDSARLQLKRLQLFLVCEPVVDNITGAATYQNPLAVVAANDYTAVGVYYMETDQPGSIMCTLEECAADAKVEPIPSN